MIDLHSHTTASDGTTTPAGIVAMSLAMGLEALAITDHDTLAGYDEAAPVAARDGLDLVCGIELSTHPPWGERGRKRSVHLLGYFLGGAPAQNFRDWLQRAQEARRDRNRRLAERLRELGVEISLWEAEKIGRVMTGRPHFARLLVEKGYVDSRDEAFDRYLGESGSAYVAREGPLVEEAIARIQEGGGMAVIAHPTRLGFTDPEAEAEAIGWLVNEGLQGIEVWHSTHTPEDEARFLELAERFKLAVSGGSDFHGDNKPRRRLGTGEGNLEIPREVLERMRDHRS